MADQMNFESLKAKAIHYICSNIKQITKEKSDFLLKLDKRTLVYNFSGLENTNTLLGRYYDRACNLYSRLAQDLREIYICVKRMYYIMSYLKSAYRYE